MFITFNEQGRVISAAGSPEELAMYETIVGSKAAERFSNLTELKVANIEDYTTVELVEELVSRHEVQSVCLTAGERFMVERDIPYILLTVPYARSGKPT